MKYITARVCPDKVYHGYNSDHQPIIGNLPNDKFVEKVIKIDRILSFTEEYIFIECPHDTVQTWKYEGGLKEIKSRLRAAGVLID